MTAAPPRRPLHAWIYALALLTTATAEVFAQDGEGWVGRRVITKFGATLQVNGQVVDDEKLENTARGGRRNVFRIYRVEQVDGRRLRLQHEKSGVAGWVAVDWLIPYDQAIDYFTNEIRADPANPSAYIRRAQIRIDKKDYDDAIADLDEAIRLNPGDEVGWVNLGIACYNKQEYDRAIAQYGEAIRLNPNDAGAYNNRGLARRAKGEYDLAIVDYGEAIRIDPSDAFIYNNRGNAWRAEKDYDRATADYAEAIRLDPKYTQAHFNRSVALMILRRDEAAEGFKTVLDLEKGPGNRSTYAVILGHLAARLGGDEAAAGAFLGDRAARLDASAWPSPAVEFLRGKLDEAGLLALAVDDGKRTEARCYLGLDKLIKGRREEALVDFRWVRDHGTTTFTEYGIALAELDRSARP